MIRGHTCLAGSRSIVRAIDFEKASDGCFLEELSCVILFQF